MKNFFKKIKYWFSPRQEWLIKKIPNNYINLDILWEICVIEGIKQYVEYYKALEHFEYYQESPNYPEKLKKVDLELKENYDIIINILPELKKKLDEAWSKIPLDEGIILRPIKTQNKEYDEIERIDNEIHDLHTKIMVWAIQNRKYLYCDI